MKPFSHPSHYWPYFAALLLAALCAVATIIELSLSLRLTPCNARQSQPWTPRPANGTAAWYLMTVPQCASPTAPKAVLYSSPSAAASDRPAPDQNGNMPPAWSLVSQDVMPRRSAKRMTRSERRKQRPREERSRWLASSSCCSPSQSSVARRSWRPFAQRSGLCPDSHKQ